MKVAIIGSRNIILDDIGLYILDFCEEIVTGGAVGIDTCAAEYAKKKRNKTYTIFTAIFHFRPSRTYCKKQKNS